MSLSSEDYEKRKKIWETIKSLGKPEQEELFRILLRNKVEYTENTNGIFFDVGKLEPSVLEQIEKFLIFCAQNRIDFELRDQTMESLRKETV
jgi:hypothetical protein